MFSVRSGTILQLGHMDYYPDGGSVQPGCLFGIDARPGGNLISKIYFLVEFISWFLGLCSHRRAVHYYLHSIREPWLFPSYPCNSEEECNNEIASDYHVRYINGLILVKKCCFSDF